MATALASARRGARDGVFEQRLAGADHDWKLRAACRGKDPRLFDAVNDNGDANPEALFLCGTCVVIKDCRFFGRRFGGFGTWGGLSERELAAMRSSPLNQFLKGEHA